MVQTDDGEVELPDFLAGHDLIVYCVLQDPSRPMMFLTDEDLPKLASGTLVVDVSCDAGMGLTWARPTSFDEPTFEVGDGVRYYAVDLTPVLPVGLGELGDQGGAAAGSRTARSATPTSSPSSTGRPTTRTNPGAEPDASSSNGFGRARGFVASGVAGPLPVAPGLDGQGKCR